MDLSGKSGKVGQTGVVITDKIGSGAFGDVYEAIISNPNQPEMKRAFKFDNGAEPDVAFGRETEVPFYVEIDPKEWKDPNIPEEKLQIRNTAPAVGPYEFVYGPNRGDKALAVIMPKLDGYTDLKSLGTLEGNPVSRPEAISVFSSVAVALNDANKIGYVHSDVKPANIMYNKDEQHARIIDWGSHVECDEINKGSTITYTDPELHTTGISDGKQDVYALGISTAEILNGEPFRSDASLGKLLLNNKVNEHYSQDKNQPTVNDPHLNAIIDLATKPKRADRSSMLDVMSHLSAFEEARIQFSKEDMNDIALNIAQVASDPNRADQRPLMAAAARGVLNDLPLNHDLHKSLETVSKLNDTYQPLAPQDNSIDQSTVLKAAQSPAHAPKRRG